jgi:hypothetical protein
LTGDDGGVLRCFRSLHYEDSPASDLADVRVIGWPADQRRAWFTEGFDTRDLKEAKALLAELTP